MSDIKTRISIGVRFGMLTISSKIKIGKWLCTCDCGGTKKVYSKFLKNGETKDCGCIKFLDNDLSGRTFGRWKVISPEKPMRIEKWFCECECGTKRIVINYNLLNGNSKSCGCIQKEVASKLGKSTVIDLIGKRFGRLIVLERVNSKHKKARWLCKCDCGNKKIILSGSLLKESTKSCGCLQKELATERAYNPNLTDKERELAKERRVDPKTIEWRRKVYKRDDYICQVCGKEGGNLTAHHKNGWNKFKEQRFIVGNGDTCCVDCHKEFHSFYGYGDNTEEEWIEFLFSKKNNIIPKKRKKRRLKIDLVGKKFNRLTVLKFDKNKSNPSWICKCECGSIKSVLEHSFKRGKTKSCGCLQKDNARKMGLNNKKRN